MQEIKWIAVAVDMFDDEKLKLIEAMPEADAIIVIWIKLLTLAGKLNAGGVLMMSNGTPYTDEMLATLFNRKLNIVRLALSVFEQYGMVEYIDDVISLPNWEKWQQIESLDKIREQTRQRVARHRARQKKLVDDVALHSVTVTYNNNNNKDNNNSSSCYRAVDFNELLTAEEIQQLSKLYENFNELIDEVQASVNKRRATVKKPYQYIIGYATKKGWQEK